LSQTRFIKRVTMVLVAMAAAIGLDGAATAAAATQTDTTVDDFLAGTPDGTYIGDSDAGEVDGEVVLEPTLAEEFEAGPGLPDGWSGALWDPAGTFEVVDGGLVVNGARAGTVDTYPAGRSLEFVATFSGGEFQHVGFGTDFNDAPWAIFSTGGGALPVGLYARTLVPGEGQQNTALDTVAIDPLAPHRYQIVWTATGATYFVDGVEVASHPTAPAVEMRPLASDVPAAPPGVSVEWLRMSPYTFDGTFESRVFDAGDSRTFWRTLTTDTVTPDGTAVSFETRTGNTPTPDASWSAWQPVGTGGAVASPFGRRYFQYRTTLTTTNDMVTPEVRSVDVTYDIDTAAPTTTIGSVTVSGTTARVTFSSEVGARFECSLGGGPFQACTSPREYTGLTPGTHTVRVRAIDQVGNVGPAAERSFVISSPPSPPPPPPNGDNTAPKVRPKPRSVRVSSRGRFTVRLRCPSNEMRCFIMLRVRYRGETIASKRVIVLGGRTANVTLSLKRFARAALQRRRRLNVLAITTARDPAGNRSVTRAPMRLRAAR
jgi:hypothetical protein